MIKLPEPVDGKMFARSLAIRETTDGIDFYIGAKEQCQVIHWRRNIASMGRDCHISGQDEGRIAAGDGSAVNGADRLSVEATVSIDRDGGLIVVTDRMDQDADAGERQIIRITDAQGERLVPSRSRAWAVQEHSDGTLYVLDEILY